MSNSNRALHPCSRRVARSAPAASSCGRLLTLREASGRTSLAVSTLRRWLREGQLPRVSLSPRAVRIRETDLVALIERRTGGRGDE